jgi:hypothetical protein
MTARDALQAAGVLQPDYAEADHGVYHFVAKDGSVFYVQPAGLFSSAKLEFIAGPRKGQSVTITGAEVDHYRKIGDSEWGQYIPGSLLREPQFIPGARRKSVPLYINDRGIAREVGWIHEKGVHYYTIPKPAII